ncbi:MAG: hypothetical protein IJ523_01755 [Succinivibrionaceae bacterium]|nr:hypothetical protein [Succinivibrionaceae bacterium]
MVRITSDVPCLAFSGSGDAWKQSLQSITNSIIFIDEGNSFVRSADFAEMVRSNSNYFVLITREEFPELHCCNREIYGIRTSGSVRFPGQICHEFYPLYQEIGEVGLADGSPHRNGAGDNR